MKQMFFVIALLTLSTSCSMMSAKPKVVYHRTDLGEVEKRVVVFPTLDFSGKKSKGAQEIDRSVLSNWTNMYGAEKILPAGPLADKIADSYPQFYGQLISSLDNVSAIEQIGKNPKFKEAVINVTKQLGVQHLAFSIIDGDSSAFEAGKPVKIHVGLFDIQNLTWKWITKIEDKKGMLSKWEVSSNAMISNSFETAKSLRRQPASQN